MKSRNLKKSDGEYVEIYEGLECKIIIAHLDADDLEQAINDVLMNIAPEDFVSIKTEAPTPHRVICTIVYKKLMNCGTDQKYFEMHGGDEKTGIDQE